MFSYDQDTLDTLVNATGLSEMEVLSNEALGMEYQECLRLQHSMGQPGKLSVSTFIDMLRRLGVSAPKRGQQEEGINWRLVKKGVRVIVTLDKEKKHLGAFQYFDDGQCVILLDGSMSGPDYFSKEAVALAPLGAPHAPVAQIPTPSVNGAPQEDTELDDEQDVQLTPEVSTEPDRADPTGRDRAPVMDNDWFDYVGGEKVWYRVGRNLCEAEFVETGPTDGHVTIAVLTAQKDQNGKVLKDAQGKKVMEYANKVVPESQVSQEGPQEKEKAGK